MWQYFKQHISPLVSGTLRRLRVLAIRFRSSIALIVIAALLVELSSAIQYYYAREYIYKTVQQNAETELQVKNLEIQKVMTTVETAVHNSVWTVEQNLQNPDSLYRFSRHLVLQNKTIVGAALLFIPDYYPQKGHWYEPYVARRENGKIEEIQLGGPEHDYFRAEWWKKAIASDHGYWSDPYFDSDGAKMMLCTYFVPVHDASGRTIALYGADVSLDWLSNVINARHVHPSSYNLMISSTGQLMVCPVESLVMRQTIQEVTARIEDTTANYVNQQMMTGKSGHADIIDEYGEKNYIFYAPVEGETGWSMAVVCSDRDLYRGLRQVNLILSLLLLAGFILMGYILWRSLRGSRRLQAAQRQKSAISRELHIASNIQMSLLPKTFPPFPERKDIDIHASLTPARDVGGDLYDYFIRDEKLYFCIGDVSGKGVPASIVMAVTRTLFRNVSALESKPNRILSAINNTLSDENPNNFFVTFFVGVLDLPTGRLRYANAGHEAPVLLSDTPSRLPCDSNIPLGAMAHWDYTLQETILDSPSTLFLFTDGLTEARDADHLLFGKERMMEQLSDVQTPQEINEHMLSAVTTFMDGAEQSDDLTMLTIRYTHQRHVVQLTRSITLPNDVHTTPQLAAFVDDVCNVLGFNASQTLQMNLAVEEAVVNVMNYAYPKGVSGDVQIDASANDERLKFTITDAGMPFDPTACPEADTTLSAEERPIGGLGIHLVRHYMDSVNYERHDDHNVFTLRKRL